MATSRISRLTSDLQATTKVAAVQVPTIRETNMRLGTVNHKLFQAVKELEKLAGEWRAQKQISGDMKRQASAVNKVATGVSALKDKLLKSSDA
jgi:hypothetical protein